MNENGGVKAGCLNYFLFCFILMGIIYLFSNSPLDAVKKTNVYDITYAQFSTINQDEKLYKEAHRKGIENIIKGGVDVKKKLKNALNDNPYIKNVSFTEVPPYDFIRVSMIFHKGATEIPASIDFMVSPRSVLDMKFAKIIGALNVDIGGSNKNENFDYMTSRREIISPLDDPNNQEVVNFLGYIYDQKELEKFINSWIAKKEKEEKLKQETARIEEVHRKYTQEINNLRLEINETNQQLSINQEAMLQNSGIQAQALEMQGVDVQQKSRNLSYEREALMNKKNSLMMNFNQMKADYEAEINNRKPIYGAIELRKAAAQKKETLASPQAQTQYPATSTDNNMSSTSSDSPVNSTFPEVSQAPSVSSANPLPSVDSDNEVKSQNSLSQQQEKPAPAFDCSKASTPAEKIVCSSKELSDADAELANIYKHALNIAKDRNALIKEQNEWLKNTRNLCADVKTMMEAYGKRTEELIVFIEDRNGI